MSYTVNPFDLLGDEGATRPRKQAPKPAAPKQAAPKPAAQPVVPKATQPPQQKPASAKPAPASSAPAKKENDVKPKPPADAQKANPVSKNEGVKKSPAPPRQHQQAGAAPGNYESEKAPRPPKDRRDTRDHPPRRGRQFDRQSGTGRPANENKKSGSGKANWGKVEDGQEPVEAKEHVEGEKEESAVVEGEAAEAEPTPKVEPEKELKGLDEYYESLKSKTVKSVEPPKLRAAGEGVDQSAWSQYAPLAKDDGDDTPIKKRKETKKEAATNGKEEKLIIEYSLPPPKGIEERRGGRTGGRGGGSGRGAANGRGKGPRGDRRGGPHQTRGPQNTGSKKEQQFAEADFPALAGSGGVHAPATAAAQQPPAVKA